MSEPENKRYLPRAQTAKRYGVADRSIARWAEDTELGFPKPIIINGRWFFELGALEHWELSRASQPRKAA